MKNKILIVKTSSLGDIIQSFAVLDEIKGHFPDCQIDWVVKKNYESLLKSHPLVNAVLTIDNHNLINFIKKLRQKKYDLLFDLQGNTKSAVITFFTRAKKKVGFGRKSVREIPNLFVTTHKYNISKEINIQKFYLSLIRAHFKIYTPSKKVHLNLLINLDDRKKILELAGKGISQYKIMIAMGSAWKNKELDPITLLSFLQKVRSRLNVFFYFVYGTAEEKMACENFKNKLKENSIVLEKMEIPVWQNVMASMDLIFTVDTAALHLAATTNTVTFSVFGPTSYKVFRPEGVHFSAQGTCPYSVKFAKQCPYLRKCSTGACIKKISIETLWAKFQPCIAELKARKL